jgi:type IV pilus assembly protein PilY1
MATTLRSSLRQRVALPLAALVFAASVAAALQAVAAPPTVPISQIPLTVAQPANPQLAWAIANSESVDGDLSGAIMAGSGSLGPFLAPLQNASSPVNYAIPPGFTPPVNPGGGGFAPYTVNIGGGTLVDNGASRLNVAKAGITAVMTTYMANVDFALFDYQTGAPNVLTTWVYYMSPWIVEPSQLTNGTPGPFIFTNVKIVGLKYVNNPCFQWPTFIGPVFGDCANLSAHYGGNIDTQQYLQVDPSSDDPAVNDVLYAGGQAAVCLAFGAVNPPTPYPPNRSLNNYKNGGVFEGYPSGVNACALGTGPTNAGFVPYSGEVMYAQRGFGYFSGQNPGNGHQVVPMTSAGATPTQASVTAALAAFAPFLAPETNRTFTPEIKALAVQSPMAGLLTGARNYLQTNPPSDNGCPPNRYIVLVTDGLPTEDLNGKNWPPLGSYSASPAGYNVFANYNGDGSLAASNDQALLDAIAVITAANNAGIKTYVIGLGAGASDPVSPAGQALTSMAVAGGTNAAMPAADVPSLLNDLSIVLAKVLQAKQSIAAGAVNSTGLNTNSVIYQAQFNSSDTQQDWTGNLFAFNIDPVTGNVNTNPAAAVWQAQTQLDLQNWNAGRIIATWDPVAGRATPFRWDGAGALLPAGISAGTAMGAALQTFPADPNGQDVLQFLRGANAQEVRFGGAFRNRTHKLGDIVYSNPVFVGAPSGYSQSPSYLAYAVANKARQPVVYIGANDGMLHAFDANTGNELFAYIPQTVWSNLVKLVNPFYSQQHLFYVNGSPQASDVQFGDGSWHTVVVETEGAGGNGVFALDVSSPSSFVTENLLSQAVLWDFTDVDMGNSFSDPAFGLMADGSWLVLFGNGYNSPSGNPYLYALNPQTGAIVGKLNLCAMVAGVCNPALPNGLSSVTLTNNGGLLGGPATVAYAGDLQGNMWRVNILNQNPGTWTATVLFQAKDSVNNPQPITTAPTVTLNPRFPQVLGTMLFTVTGELLGTQDLTNNQVQSVYGVYDPPNTYAVPLQRAGLVQETMTQTAFGGIPARQIVGNAISLPGQKGWFIDLSLVPGERGVTDPQLVSGGGVLFTTYSPAANLCIGGGSAWLMDLNYTGGAFPSPQFSIGDKNTVGFSLGTVYAASPALLSYSGSGKSELALVSTSGGNSMSGQPLPPGSCPGNLVTCSMLSIQITGTLKHRKAWWEVR